MTSSRARAVAAATTLLAAAALLAEAARAQASAEQLRQCAELPEATQRLSCYDRLAGARAAEATTATAPNLPKASPPAPASLPTQTATAAAVAEFGVSEGPLARSRPEAGLSGITDKVASLAHLPRGQLRVTLQNGQVWEELQPNDSFSLKVGDEVQIRSAALGSFIMVSPHGWPARVTRIH